MINVQMFAAVALDNLDTLALTAATKIEDALETYRGNLFFPRDTIMPDLKDPEEYRRKAFAPSMKNVLEKTLVDLGDRTRDE